MKQQVTKHKMFNICLTIKARDYAAFEDLANECGVDLKITGLADDPDNVPQQGELFAKPDKQRKRPVSIVEHKRHLFITPAEIGAILTYFKNNPTSTEQNISDALDMPYSRTTINRVLSGVHTLQTQGLARKP